MAVCRSKHVEQLRNTGIINSTTRSHLVGYFYKIKKKSFFKLTSHILIRASKVCMLLFPDAPMEAHTFSHRQNLTPIERVAHLGVPVPQQENSATSP